MKTNNINNPKEVLSFMLFIISFTVFLLLCACSPAVMNNNIFYQNNYGEECLYPPHTDSYKNLLFCYQENQSKEHAQNNITNKLAQGGKNGN